MILTNTAQVKYVQLMPDGSQAEIIKKSNTVQTYIVKATQVVTYQNQQLNTTTQNNITNSNNLLNVFIGWALARRINNNFGRLAILLFFI